MLWFYRIYLEKKGRTKSQPNHVQFYKIKWLLETVDVHKSKQSEQGKNLQQQQQQKPT